MHPPDLTFAEPSAPADDHLLVRVGAELFALPLAAVEEAVGEPEVVAMPGASGDVLGVLRWRGSRVPLHGAARAFGIASASPAAVALVLRAPHAPGAFAAVAVDELVGAVPLDPQAVRGWACRDDPHRVIGGVAMIDGRVAAVVRPEAAVAALLSHHAPEAAA